VRAVKKGRSERKNITHRLEVCTGKTKKKHRKKESVGSQTQPGGESRIPGEEMPTRTGLWGGKSPSATRVFAIWPGQRPREGAPGSWDGYSKGRNSVLVTMGLKDFNAE